MYFPFVVSFFSGVDSPPSKCASIVYGVSTSAYVLLAGGRTNLSERESPASDETSKSWKRSLRSFFLTFLFLSRPSRRNDNGFRMKFHRHYVSVLRCRETGGFSFSTGKSGFSRNQKVRDSPLSVTSGPPQR